MGARLKATEKTNNRIIMGLAQDKGSWFAPKTKGKLGPVLQNAIYKWEMPFRFTIMAVTIKLDKAGRVVIPKPLRDEMGLGTGDAFKIEKKNEKLILSPIYSEPRYYKKHGILVRETGVPITVEMVNSVIQEMRDEREARWLGKS